jgi:phosphotransferase system HPr-like phosphotransfer protein
MRDVAIKFIRLNTQAEVAGLVHTLGNKCKHKVDMKHSEHVVDAKSIMGIFSLNLSEPVAIMFENIDDYNNVKDYVSVLEDEIANNEWREHWRSKSYDCY